MKGLNSMNTVRAGENPTAPEFRVLDSTARKVELSITYMVENLDRPLPVSKLAEIAKVVSGVRKACQSILLAVL